MGFSVKFNWVLQIEPPDSLRFGGAYSFEKTGNRVFPLDVPIDLIDPQRNAVAKIRIKSFTNEEGLTTGEFVVLKIYMDQERVILTNYWIENR